MPLKVPFVVAECKLRQETKQYYHTFPNAGVLDQIMIMQPCTENTFVLICIAELNHVIHDGAVMMTKKVVCTLWCSKSCCNFWQTLSAPTRQWGASTFWTRFLKLYKSDTTHQHIFESSRKGALGGSETLTSKLKAFDYLSLTFIWNNVACLLNLRSKFLVNSFTKYFFLLMK